MTEAYTPATMTRRRHGEGQIRQRPDGRIEIRLRQAGMPRQSIYLPKGTAMKAAIKERNKALQKAEAGTLVGTARQTMEQFLEAWLVDVAPRRLRARSLERYEGIVRQYLVPQLGKVRLERLSAQHIDRLHAACLRSLRPSTVGTVHACLRSALTYAVDRRILPMNPADGVKPPRVARMPMKALSPSDSRRFLDAVSGDPLEAMYVLAIGTGMRLGELLALRWSDVVDLGRMSTTSRIAVQQTLTRIGTSWYLAEPKTPESRRMIRLGRRGVRALLAHRTRQKRMRMAAGTGWADHNFIFADRFGEPLVSGHITSRELKPLLRRAGLPEIRFHDLRHTAATLLLGQGINPKIVSEMLGHSSVTITLDRYSHVTPSMGAIAAAAMDEVLR